MNRDSSDSEIARMGWEALLDSLGEQGSRRFLHLCSSGDLEKFLEDRQAPQERKNYVELSDTSGSRHHARLVFSDGVYRLIHESKTTFTYLNGERVEESAVLSDNDFFTMGSYNLCFRFERRPEGPVTLSPRHLSVLFSDIRGFTTLAEIMPLKEVTGQLQEFFFAMGEVIEENHGTIVEYAGDAVLAIFGIRKVSENHAACAVRAAVSMQKRLARLNEAWAASSRSPLRIGIGINTGEMMIGNIGYKTMSKYTILGDNVNLAARLESLTKEYPAEIIIAESAREAVGDEFALKALGRVTVRGKSIPVNIYAVIE